MARKTKMSAADLAEVEAGTRWSKNILTELLGNHSAGMAEDARGHMRAAIESLSALGAVADLRKPSSPAEVSP